MINAQEITKEQNQPESKIELPGILSAFFQTSSLHVQSLIIKFPENWYTLHNQLVSSSPVQTTQTDNSNTTNTPSSNLNTALPQKFEDLGAQLAWNQSMTLSQENYDKYLELWNKKTLQKTGDYQVIIEPTDITQVTATSSKSWLLRLIGEGRYSRLAWVYHLDSQSWQSPNMQLNYLGDIHMHKQSVLGEWSGKAWQNSRQNSQGMWIETLALGKDINHKTILIYRTQAINPKNELWLDESLILRSES